MTRCTRTPAFTIIELLAVLAIFVLLAATFVPYALSLRETSNRASCAKNLLDVYWALSQYAKQNGYASYPRTRFDPAMGNRWTAFTGADDPAAVEANDVSASIWLLVRGGLLKPSSLVCPSSDGTADDLHNAVGEPVDASRRGNFRSRENLTYAIASPFSAVPDYAFNDTLPSNFVLVADQGPPAATLTAGAIPAFDAPPSRLSVMNSPNHRGGGQNVLYASGEVKFVSSPYCGVGRTRETADPRSPERLDGDNIYTALAPTPLINSKPSHEGPGVAGANVGPSYRYDTYLVPGAGFVAPASPRPMPPLAAAASAKVPSTLPATTRVAASGPAVTRP